MKTFKQFITELDHGISGIGYKEYGVIHHETGKIISGNAHPRAKTHNDLPRGAQYAHVHHGPGHPDNHLMIRTNSNKDIHHVLKHFDKLPHSPSGNVRWEHTPHRPDKVHRDSPESLIGQGDRQRAKFAKADMKRTVEH